MKRGFVPIPLIIIVGLVGLLGGGTYLYNIKIHEPNLIDSSRKIEEGFGNIASPTPDLSPQPIAISRAQTTNGQTSVAKKTPTPTPKTSTSATTTTTTYSQTTNTQSPSFKLDSITPSSGKASEQVTLRGSGFGTSAGLVIFETSTSGGCCGVYADSWSDYEIKVKVLSFGAKGIRQVSVQKLGGSESNQINFDITAGQPYIASYSPNPVTNISSPFTINGEEFGNSQGSVDFYYNNSKIGSCTSGSGSSWSESKIVCYVNMTYVAEYGFQVKTSDGRESSFKYVQLSQ